MYACHATQFVKVGGDCIGATVVALNEGSSVKLRTARIAHANIRRKDIDLPFKEIPSITTYARPDDIFNMLHVQQQK